MSDPTVAWSPGSTEGMKSHCMLLHPHSCLCLVRGEPDTNPQQDRVQTFQLTPRGIGLYFSTGIRDPRDPDPWGILQHHLGMFKCMLHIQPPPHLLAVPEAWLLPARCPHGPGGLAAIQGHQSGGSAGMTYRVALQPE